MTVKAYVLIEAQIGKTKQVVEAIRNIQGVASVDVVTGPYDAIAVIQTETLNDFEDLVVEKMHLIAGISRALTCVAV
jgi:DNA-binding Lrp family transcriptional regulator